MQIRDTAVATPDKPAIIMYPSGTVVTFGELEARANRLAHFFRAQGLTEGDAVAILMENNEHMHAVMWAARRAGLATSRLGGSGHPASRRPISGAARRPRPLSGRSTRQLPI